VDASRNYLKVAKYKRPSDASGDLVKLSTRATEALATKFRLMPLSWKDGEHLDNMYRIQLLMVQIINNRTRFDIQVVFESIIALLDTTGKEIRVVRNLLENYTSLSVEDVHQSGKHYRYYGKGYHLQNLYWSQYMTEKSCETELRNKILKKCMGIPI
jgi:hypothetical protein